MEIQEVDLLQIQQSVQMFDRQSSIERLCRFVQSSGKIKAAIMISVTSFICLLGSKENKQRLRQK